ncbi:hypothetical protein [Parasphingorhabdus cellanae]|uniref:Uncharacterized protein n=1 Tax=Parasphingorhabdus cellanae TaxID=2806553 RepID=A0ABX7T324_9SPHN|nr:hypothetical protein [Parasphingorhabdus cellanae]QTD55207.1 hypothetical protein J4G78_13375 [Parasphingorhabdus cellanae]
MTGYWSVSISSTRKPKDNFDVRSMTDALGLKVLGSHINWKRLREDPPYTVEESFMHHVLQDDVQKIRDHVARTGKTPFMGEFGAIDLIPVAERVQYQKAVRTAFDAVGIGMCAWAYTNTFPLYDSRTKEWLPGMLDAMGLKDK